MEPFERVYQICGRGMWLVDRLTYWKDTAELKKWVIETAGMDPTKVTPDELDSANLKFAVFTGLGSSTITIVGWRCLVSCGFAGFLLSVFGITQGGAFH